MLKGLHLVFITVHLSGLHNLTDYLGMDSLHMYNYLYYLMYMILPWNQSTKENPKMGGLCIWPKSVHQGPIQNDVSVLITCYTKKHASAVWYIKRNYYGIATSQKLGKQFSMILVILVFFGASLIQRRMGGGFFYALLWSTARRQPDNRGKGSVPVRARQKQFFLVHASQV